MKAPTNGLPRRRHLPHGIPSWVDQGAKHFITINSKERKTAALINPSTADSLMESAKFYEQQGKWFVWLMLLMPDHIHMIITPDLSKGIRKIVSAWKGYQKRTVGVVWQSDFFEHRLRNEKEFEEKAAYIRMNPVRKGLIEAPQDWQYIFDRTGFG